MDSPAKAGLEMLTSSANHDIALSLTPETMLLLLLSMSTADAKGRALDIDAASIRNGDDIAAWEDVDAADADDLEAFIVAFPNSKLSELAWQKLEVLGESGPDLSKSESTRVQTTLAEQNLHLQAPSAAPVQTLSIGSQTPVYVEPTVDKRIHPLVEMGWTGSLGSAGMYVHAGMGGEHFGVAVRGTAGLEGADLGVATRATLSSAHLSPYAEVFGVVRDPALGAAVGVSQPLRNGFALSLAVETMIVGQEPQPTVRFGAGKVF